MKRFPISIVLIAIALSGFAQSNGAILGHWVNATGEAHIEIFKKGNKYYGKIVSLKDPKDEKGKVKTDINNPEIDLRSRPILGLEILKGFVFEDGKWKEGKIYDPKTGKTYSCNMTMKTQNLLSIRGYIGISLIGRSETWKRVK